MLTKTYISSNIDKELLDKLILIQKEEKVSQQELANRIGIKQQTIPRTEYAADVPVFDPFEFDVPYTGPLQVVTSQPFGVGVVEQPVRKKAINNVESTKRIFLFICFLLKKM